MTSLGFATTTMFLIAGMVAGQAYFAALRQSLAGLAAGSRLSPVLLTLGRFAGVALFLSAAAWVGALPLLGAFLGFLVARSIALRAGQRDA